MPRYTFGLLMGNDILTSAKNGIGIRDKTPRYPGLLRDELKWFTLMTWMKLSKQGIKRGIVKVCMTAISD
ncbi:MAG: hypothetical protein BA871_12515 [Desulfuromonadales bacterium C00003096]|nr:MAG: hypothetical protein BA871_12515 [Desulfuromonadales bacterium C00003096]